MHIEGFHDRDGYVEAVLGGPFQAAKLEEVIGSVVQAVSRKGANRLLLNTLAMTGPGPSFMERYKVGISMLPLPKGVRVANLVKPEWIDPEKFGLRVAQNRGIDADIFSDLDQALAWLLGKSEKPPEAPPPPAFR